MKELFISKKNQLNAFRDPREPYIGILDSKEDVLDCIDKLNKQSGNNVDTNELEKIDFQETAKFILFFGRIIPENVSNTFGPFESEFYYISPKIHTNIIICCEYFNSATARKFSDFFCSLKVRGNYSIYWLYSDSTGDMPDHIDDFTQVSGVNIISI